MEANTTLFLCLVMMSSMLQGFHCTNISILFISSGGNEFDSTGARRAIHMAVEQVNDKDLLRNYTLQIIEQGDYNTMVYIISVINQLCNTLKCT